MENEVHAHRDGSSASSPSPRARPSRPARSSAWWWTSDGRAGGRPAPRRRRAHPRDAERPAAARRRRPAPLTVRPVTLAAGRRYQWTSHFATRTTDENLTREQTRERLVELLRGEYRQGLLHGPDADFQVLAGGRSARVLERPPTRPHADEARPPQAARAPGGRAGAVPRRARRDDADGRGARQAPRQVPPGQPLPRAGRGRAPGPARAAIRCAWSTSAAAGRTSPSRCTTCSSSRHGRERGDPRARPQGGRRGGVRGARRPPRPRGPPLRRRRHRGRRRVRAAPTSSSASTRATRPPTRRSRRRSSGRPR